MAHQYPLGGMDSACEVIRFDDQTLEADPLVNDREGNGSFSYGTLEGLDYCVRCVSRRLVPAFSS